MNDKMNDKNYRTFNIMQYEFHPTSGEPLLSKSQIEDALSHKTIKEWAYIYHDKDVYTEEDYKNFKKRKPTDEPTWKIGDVKPSHWHIVISITPAKPISKIAEWFGIAENFIDVPYGRGAFLDCVKYLTHEKANQQALGKALYTDAEVIANFDFRQRLDKRDLKIAKFGKDLDDKTQMKYEVLYEGKTLYQCQNENELLYLEIYEDLKKLRREYLLQQKAPTTRLNYYICGSGGIGKGLMSRALARSLYPQYENDEEIFFCIGGDKKITFDGYDGQPVIIWNDVRAIELMYKLGGRGNVFDIFDTHPSPTQGRQNIKYGSIKLCNEVNIVNSVEGYEEFLDGLAGEYITKDGEKVLAEDKGQSYRRFPMIMPLHQDDFDLLLNKGFMEDTNDFEEYIAYRHIRGNMQKIAIACSNNEKLARELEARSLALPIKKHQELKERAKSQVLSEDDIREMFKDYGTQADAEPTPSQIERINNHQSLRDEDGYFPSLGSENPRKIDDEPRTPTDTTEDEVVDPFADAESKEHL